jgi:hypothetical protein
MTKSPLNRDRHREREDPHRQIPPHSDSPGLLSYLEELFCLHPRVVEPGKVNPEPDAFPDRVILRAAFGMGGKDLGPAIYERTWKPTSSRQPGKEELVALSNVLLAKARHDCQAIGRPQLYVILAYNNGRGATAYARHLLALVPGPREYDEKSVPAEEDGSGHSTTASALLAQVTADRRFLLEHSSRMLGSYQSAVEGLLAKFEARLTQTENANSRLLEVSAELARVRADLDDRRATRERLERREAFVYSKIEQGMAMLQGYLPAVIAYASKASAGVLEGVRAFVASLDEAQREALFGPSGILNDEQKTLFIGIVDGTVAPCRLGEFIETLTPDQMAGAQRILAQAQLVNLLGVADAVRRAQGESGSAASAS